MISESSSTSRIFFEPEGTVDGSFVDVFFAVDFFREFAVEAFFALFWQLEFCGNFAPCGPVRRGTGISAERSAER